MSLTRTALRIIGLLSLAVALSACNAIKLGYNNLPELGYWWLDGYFDFGDDQAQWVRQDIARLHAWHRSNELGRYIALLQRMERIAPADTTAEQVCAFEPELRQRAQAVTQRAEPVVVTTAMAMGPAQLQHLERKYEQNLKDYQKDWLRLSPPDRLDKRQKEVQERLERAYGPLADPQRAALRQQLERSVFDPQRVLAERRRRQQDTLAVLGKVASQPVPLGEAQVLLRGLVERTIDSPDPAYRSYQTALRQESCRLIASVHNGTTATQRDNAVRRLRGWQRDLSELASQQ